MPQPAPVSRLLDPRSVAVIGASEDQGKFGGRAFRMLLRHKFGGAIYPINPNRAELFGLKTYPDIAATPRPADMVVMAIPQPKVKEAVAAAAAAGVKGAVIITAKFADAGPAGAATEREIVDIARAHGMRLIGPNCLGVISPANRLVLCSSPALDVDELIVSPIGLVSQSGALMATLFDAAYDQGIGFTHCVSVGNQADLELCDFVEFLIEDPATRVICSYVEGIKDPARFVALARRAREAGKPWLMVKAGRTEAGTRAAFSHTASLAGSYQALEAVCRANGIVMMDDPDAMILLAAGLARFPGRKVDRVAVITTSGGGGAISADRLSDLAIPLAGFEPATRQRLDADFPPEQAANPIDLGGRREGEAAGVAHATMAAVGQDANVDLTLFLITTAPMLHRITADLADAALAAGDKPFLFVMQPGKAANAARAELIRRGLPFCNRMDDALRAIAGWRAWSALPPPQAVPRPVDLPDLAELDLPSGALDEVAAKRLARAYGVAVNRGVVASELEEAVLAANRLGFPVVAKVLSADIVHKSDVGGVAVNIADEAALAEALARMARAVAERMPGARLDGFLIQEQVRGDVELIVGTRFDPQFGPIVLVGLGGVLVELMHDVAVAPAPVSPAQAALMLGGLRGARLLDGARGRPPVDKAALAGLVSRVSWLAADLGPRLLELDLNPVIAGPDGAVAVDARAAIA